MARDEVKQEPALAATVDTTGSAVVRHAELTAHPGWRALEDAQRDATSAIGRYQVLRALGAGGMGIVYEALDPSLERRVALKVLRRPDRSVSQQARFAREARALAKLQHPNVVAVYDTGESERGAYVVMQLVDGEPMDRVMQRGPMPWRQAVAMVTAAGRGLAAAHAAGIVHRDVKPSNIFIDRDGAVRVGDFGLARSFEEATPEPASGEVPALAVDVTQTGAVLGTPRYMAPEQHLGQPATAQSDQFSLCVTLYEALYGAHPFAPASRDMALALAAMRADAVRPAPPDVRVPRRLERALRRGLRFDAAERFPSMEGLVAALAPLRRRGALLGAALVMVGAALSLGLWLSPRDTATTPVRRGTPPQAVQVARLTRFGDAGAPEVSPDGRRLLYGRSMDLYVRHLDGSVPDRKIASRVRSARWSPRGDRLLTRVHDEDRSSILTPDGERLRDLPPSNYQWASNDEVVGWRHSRKEVTFLDLRTGATRRCPIPGSYTWLLYVEVSHRSGRILAVTTRESNQVTLWTFERDCSAMRPLVVTDVHATGRWSADGDAVIFTRRGRAGGSDVVLIPLAWPWMRRLLVEGIDVRWFSVGPEGSLYYANDDGASHVWRLSTRSAPVRLTSEARPRWDLEVTEDGAAATFGESSERSEMFVRMPLDGSAPEVLFEVNLGSQMLQSAALSTDQRRLGVVVHEGSATVTRVLNRGDVSSAWPRGEALPLISELAWSRGRLFLHLPGNRAFSVVAPDGTKTKLPARPEVGWIFHPRVSPDERTVAVTWNRSDGPGLWTIGLDDGAERFLGRNLQALGWSRDGSRIFAASPTLEKYWSVPRDGGAPLPWVDVGSLGSVSAAASMPDGDALVLVDSSSADLFVLPGVAR